MIETNFKHTDIGLIPHDWEVKELEPLCSKLCVGFVGTCEPYYVSAGRGVKMVRTGDLKDSYVDLSNTKFISYDFHRSHLKSQLKRGDILIARHGSNGHGVIYDSDAEANSLNIVILRTESISNKYIIYLLDSPSLRLQIEGVTAGSTQRVINTKEIAKLQIPLPPTLAEQEKIANALSKIDQLINDLGALIEKKKAIKQGTMQDLLTAKRRLKGFTGEWRDKKLDEMGFLTAGGTPSTIEPSYWGGDINWLQSGAVQNCIITPDAVVKTISKEGLQNSAAYLIKPDSVLIAITGATCANVGYLTFESAANQSVVSIEPNKENCAMFLFQKLLTERTNILSNKGGSAQSGVTLKALKQLTITIPPTIAEQRAIAAVLSGMDTEIATLEQKRDKYIAIKSGMMQDLLTGKIRLI